jgi:hypothetical protein
MDPKLKVFVPGKPFQPSLIAYWAQWLVTNKRSVVKTVPKEYITIKSFIGLLWGQKKFFASLFKPRKE